MNKQVFYKMKEEYTIYEAKIASLEQSIRITSDMYGNLSDECTTARKVLCNFRDTYKSQYNRGCSIAYRAYMDYEEGKYGEFAIDEFFWEQSDVVDFLNTLREAEIETFVIIDHSTALMENIHWFVKNGCTMLGICEVHTNRAFGETYELGLSFRVNTFDKD